MKPTKRFADKDFESLLAQIADDYSDKLAAGSRPNIEEYARLHPNIADAIRRVLPALGALNDSSETSAVNFLCDGEVFPSSETLGDFRIVREIGRGGMGIVYEAIEQSLGRSVALKVLPCTAMLEEKQLTRFKNEARAAATLGHRNIVPVYSFGSQGGVYFYSMEFIRGQSMAELIRGLRRVRENADEESQGMAATFSKTPISVNGSESRSTCSIEEESTASPEKNERTSISKGNATFFQNVARLGAQAARALDHAHSEGVLHRDIKPANLMIDDNLQLRITDFGLARLGDNAGVTVTGDLLGTARYMSPEQILAKRTVADHRADIYSLGITLYELATLQVAFEGEDRYELWRKISFESPTSPRKINDRIPADLETIILKSIEKEPADRYQTAGEVADDLQRFLDYKPIHAKPPTFVEAVAKWTQRHQSFVWLAMGVMATLIAILGASIFFINSAYQVAQSQRFRAESHLQLARDVIDDTYHIELERLKHAPGMTQKQRETLLSLMKFYEQLPREELNDDSLYHESVKARLRLGDIHIVLGRFTEASAAFQDAIDSAQQLCARSDDPNHRASLALAYSGLGQVQLVNGKRNQSIKSHRTASVLIDALLKGKPDDLEIQRLAAEKIYLPISLERTTERTAAFSAVIDELNCLARRFPEESKFPNAMALAQDQFGLLLQSTGQMSEAEKMLRAAAEIQMKLATNNPENPTFKFQQANTLGHLAVLLRQKGSSRVATEFIQQAIALLDNLVNSYPHRVRYQATLARMRNDLGKLLYAGQNPQGAATEFEKAIAILEPLASSDPDTPEYRFSLASNLNNLGAVTARTDASTSLSCKQRAMELWLALAEQYPDNAKYQSSVAVGYANSANRLDLTGRINAYKEATRIFESLSDRFPERIEYTQKLIRYKTILGNEFAKAKRMSEADAEFQDVIRLSESFSSRYPEFAREDEQAVNSVTRAELTWRMGKVEETVMARQIAIDRYRLLLDKNSDNVEYKSELCSQMKRLAYAYLSLGQFELAFASCQESITLNKQLCQQDPEAGKYVQKLVRRHELLWVIQLKNGNHAGAEEALRQKLDAMYRLAHAFPTTGKTAEMARARIETRVRLANVIVEADRNRLDEALQELRLAYELTEEFDLVQLSVDVLLNHGMLLNDYGHFDQAREKLNDALQLAESIRGNLNATDLKGQAAILAKQWRIGSELARSGEEKQSNLLLQPLIVGLQSEPGSQQDAVAIANWKNVSNKHLQDAVEASIRQVNEQPENGRVWLNHGFVQLRALDFQDAIDSLERAAALRAPAAANNLLLAVAHAKTGDKATAKQYYDQAKGSVLFGDAFQLIEMRRLQEEARLAMEQVDH